MGTFDQAIIREIGRSYGAAISNYLLGDKHARPVRVSDGTLGASSGGYKYENELDRQINTSKIKGGAGNITTAQNVSNAYFDLVSEAKSNSISPNELLYLLKKYVSTRNFMAKLWEANIEIKANNTEVIINRIKSLDEFIKEMHGQTIGKEPTKPSFNRNDVFWMLGTLAGLLLFIFPSFFIINAWVKAKRNKKLVYDYIVVSQAYLNSLNEFIESETYDKPFNIQIN